MRRRDFMSLIGAAATLSLVERTQAQQRPTPIVGILSPELATVPDVQGLREFRNLVMLKGEKFDTNTDGRTEILRNWTIWLTNLSN